MYESSTPKPALVFISLCWSYWLAFFQKGLWLANFVSAALLDLLFPFSFPYPAVCLQDEGFLALGFWLDAANGEHWQEIEGREEAANRAPSHQA